MNKQPVILVTLVYEDDNGLIHQHILTDGSNVIHHVVNRQVVAIPAVPTDAIYLDKTIAFAGMHPNVTLDNDNPKPPSFFYPGGDRS